MLQEVVTGTSIIYYLMILVASVGVLAKVINHFTLRSMVKSASNMQKSTHKLIKLVRSKYEHACMLHDRVENVEAFVEKYIYEYRGILFRIHTWRQLEIQSIWFLGILGFLGASCWYLKSGLCEEVYRYAGLGAAGMMLLFVVSQLSDEQHKILRIQNYMVDYLENVCAFRHRRARQSEREHIEVIQTENGKARVGQADVAFSREKMVENKAEQELFTGNEHVMQFAQEENASGKKRFVKNEAFSSRKKEEWEDGVQQELPINIEGEPRKVGKSELAKKVFGKTEKESDEAHASMQEETLRRILEEFLA